MSDASAAVERFAAVLRRAALDPTAIELAEVLWLASKIPAGAVFSMQGGERTGQREEVRRAQKPADIKRPRAQEGQSLTERREPAAGMFLEGGAAAQGVGAPMRSPTGTALPGALALARALRPLKRRVLSRTHFELDDVSTADRMAMGVRPAIAVQPMQDRWLDLALVVDESASMAIWERTLGELRALLGRLGAFRTISVHRLLTEEGAALRLCRDSAGAARSMSHGELFDPLGRRMILVVSDCVASAWDDGRAGALLGAWGRRAPVAVLQVLPERLWQRSGLGAAEVVRLRAPAVGVPSAKLAVERLSLGLAPEEVLPGAVAVPVVELAARSAGAWARLVAGGGGARTAGVLLPMSEVVRGVAGDEEGPGEEELTGEERVARFRSMASPLARKLAILFAAAPLSLPVMRLIREAMLPAATVGHLAEVFLGGLLRKIGENASGSGPEYVRYEFFAGVRERLLDSAERSEAVGVLERVSEYVTTHFGSALDFRVWLADPAAREGAGRLAPEDRPFAAIGASVLQRMGGEHARLGQRLVRGLSRSAVDGAARDTTSTRTDPSRKRIAEHAKVAEGDGPVVTHDWIEAGEEDIEEGFTEEPASTSDRPRLDDNVKRGVADVPPIRAQHGLRQSLDIYVSYAPADDELRAELEKHLANLQRDRVLRTWSQSCIAAGDDRRKAVEGHIAAADVVLLLVSADYLASDYLHDIELTTSLARRRVGDARVIPVLLRACEWKIAAFAGLSALPKTGVPVTSWPNRDEAWATVARAIGEAIAGEAGTPAPAYESPEIRALAEQLERAQLRKAALAGTGVSTEVITREILDLRRRLREGGRLRAGDALGDGRYLLLQPLGHGGFASVWAALDRAGGEQVAIKVLPPSLAHEAASRERFFRGARVMGSLRHEGVVRVLEARGEDGGYLYFVMELVAGKDLYRAVVEKRLRAEDTASLILSVGEALGEAHALGIVHRDVKPANIVLDASGRPKLTDFDLVAAKDTTGGTRTGAMGAFLFTAPEQMNNAKEADARADVYGLGMTALFCLHGRELPAIVTRKPEQVIERLPCSDAVKVVVARAIEVEPEKRYADARAFCEALREAAGMGARVKGFVIDDQHLANPPGPGVPDYFDDLLDRIRDIRASDRRAYVRVREIFALAVDYQPNAPATGTFFQSMQNKLHFAATGKTAPEIIQERADHTQPNMGLRSWKGKVLRKGDVTIAKNYLTEPEIDELNRIVVMFLDYAEDQTRQRKLIYMAEWAKKLDAFLAFNERRSLPEPARWTREDAERVAESEYERFAARRRETAEIGTVAGAQSEHLSADAANSAISSIEEMLADIEGRLGQLARMCADRQRLNMLVWICRARSIEESLPGVRDVEFAVARVARRLTEIGKMFWPGSVRALQLSARPADVRREMHANWASEPTNWVEATSLAERLLAEHMQKSTDAGLDEDGWADAALRAPRPPDPDALFEELEANLKTILVPPGEGPNGRHGELTANDMDALVSAARKLRWVRGAIKNDLDWGVAMGRLRRALPGLGAGAARVKEILDARYRPSSPWQRIVGESVFTESPARLQADLPAALENKDALMAWLIRAFGVLNTPVLVEMLRPGRDLLGTFTEEELNHPERGVRRRLRELVKRMAEAEAAPVKEVAKPAPPPADELAQAEIDLLSARVRAQIQGRRALFVSNRENPELGVRLTDLLGITIIWCDGSLRRVQAQCERIQRGSYDLVLNAVDFQPRGINAILARASSTAGVPYVRVATASLTACILALVHEFDTTEKIYFENVIGDLDAALENKDALMAWLIRAFGMFNTSFLVKIVQPARSLLATFSEEDLNHLDRRNGQRLRDLIASLAEADAVASEDVVKDEVEAPPTPAELDGSIIRKMLQTTFISYGSPDEPFVRKLYEALHRNGVTTFFFPEHAVPGEKLHRMMRKGVNEHDRVILVCSEASLDRKGVANEIEETLAREARDGGVSYLIPIRLDGYMFSGWTPPNLDTAQAVRDRVVADFEGAEADQAKFDAGILRLIAALKK